MEDKIIIHLYINGRVQGVFFRRSAKNEAEKLGLVGWIRNRQDGGVDAVAQGSQENIDKFIKWCRRGPPFGKVEKVEVERKRKLVKFEGFEIV